jgi:hypothetical protein
MTSPADNENQDKEWADMKTGWKATSLAETFMTEKLRWGLRLRMIGSWLWIGVEVASLIMLAVIATIEMFRGNFIVAAAILVLGIAAGGASLWARRSPLRLTSGSLLELIELTIHRARRSERFAWAQYFTSAATAVFLIAMYVATVNGAMTPYGDGGRLIASLVICVLYAMGVGVYHWVARRRGRRFRELRGSFAATPREANQP